MKDNKYIEITNFDGTKINIKVTINIYNDYKRSLWREEYQNKKSERELHHEDINEKFIPPQLCSPSSEESYFRKIKYEKLFRAIEKLPALEKKRIILHYFYNFEISEISILEEKTIRVVEISIKRVKEKLLNE